LGLQSYVNNPWIISQFWSDLIFINYEVDPTLLQERLPKGLTIDTFENKAYLSIVPFKMSKVRFPLTPSLPFSTLWELNIRTYVKLKGQSGIYFFTLDTDHWLAALIAKKLFSLPYRYTKLSGHCVDDNYQFRSKNLNLRASLSSKRTKHLFEKWIVERYLLYTDAGPKIFSGQAMHQPWLLRDVKIHHFEQSFLQEFGFDNINYHSIFSGNAMNVRFKPFKRVL